MHKVLKRSLAALALAFVLIISTIEPVTAQAAETSGWVELLEFSSIQADGSNTFTMTSSGKLSIPVYAEKRFRKVDILISNPSGQRFTSATCTVGTKTNTLEVLAIGGNLTRIVGYIPDAFYEAITIDLKKSTATTQTYEVLSWKVTPVGDQEFVCDARVFITGGYYGINEHIDIGQVTPDQHVATAIQTRIDIMDWAKYDNITIWGSTDGLSIDSIRASLNTAGLPIEVNLFQCNDAGSWTEFVFDIDPYTGEIDGGAAMSTPFYGKYLYCISIDLAGVDRAQTGYITLYLTGHYDTMYGATFNCQYVNGHVYTADTSAVTWWNRFTEFFTNLLGSNSADGENFAEEMEEQAQDMEDAVDQMEQVTRPPVEDLDVSIDAYVTMGGMAQIADIYAVLMNNTLVMGAIMITMLLSLAAYVIFGKR